jgi:hypothetical protein
MLTLYSVLGRTAGRIKLLHGRWQGSQGNPRFVVHRSIFSFAFMVSLIIMVSIALTFKLQ